MQYGMRRRGGAHVYRVSTSRFRCAIREGIVLTLQVSGNPAAVRLLVCTKQVILPIHRWQGRQSHLYHWFRFPGPGPL